MTTYFQTSIRLLKLTCDTRSLPGKICRRNIISPKMQPAAQISTLKNLRIGILLVSLENRASHLLNLKKKRRCFDTSKFFNELKRWNQFGYTEINSPTSFFDCISLWTNCKLHYWLAAGFYTHLSCLKTVLLVF